MHSEEVPDSNPFEECLAANALQSSGDIHSKRGTGEKRSLCQTIFAPPLRFGFCAASTQVEASCFESEEKPADDISPFPKRERKLELPYFPNRDGESLWRLPFLAYIAAKKFFHHSIPHSTPPLPFYLLNSSLAVFKTG
ncbi:hypothetical protein CEXT_418231 [Caerostris extrusa]|uniref:Uncharacterized protein n=1 Tax=Caerostris extrusa TaxID=172846 RepID=A0AAV4WXH4_CAEEX|nr:hypothetical protein CEXT_418231 [Caerostris extrusa]